MRYFYKLLHDYYSLFMKDGSSVLEIDAQGDYLKRQFDASVRYKMISSAELSDSTMLGALQPGYDYIVLNGNLHYECDIQGLLEKIRVVASPQTRILIIYYSTLWKPLFKIATLLGLRKRSREQNWIAHEDVENILILAGYELVRRDNKVLVPFYVPLLSGLANRFLAPLPCWRFFSMINIVVARPLARSQFGDRTPSVSVVIPARNEAGNIENAIKRMPRMGPDDEIIFIEGNSTDNTWDVIRQMYEKYKGEKNIRIDRQTGKGKGDAVRKGFGMARGDILMILDADLTVPPEELPKFYRAIVDNRGEFINGSRLVYPMEGRAMRFFNLVGNKFFALMFSYLIGQRFKDTLCGTKVLSKDHYRKVAEGRSYFGDFDPFGDFDLLFGASRLGLKIVELPIAYKERTYGDTNISRWKHGVILLRMVMFAARKIKFI